MFCRFLSSDCHLSQQNIIVLSMSELLQRNYRTADIIIVLWGIFVLLMNYRTCSIFRTVLQSCRFSLTKVIIRKNKQHNRVFLPNPKDKL